MKKIISFLVLVASYILLGVLNNIRTILIIGKKSLFTTNMLYTGPMIVSGICLLLIFVFYKKAKEYKKITFSVIFVMFSCALLNGIFPDKQLTRYIIVYLIMLFNALVATKFTGERFEFAIFISNAVLILMAILFAMFNILSIFRYVLVIIEICLLVYLIVCEIKNKEGFIENEIKDKVNVNSLIIFSIMFVFFVMGGINRYVHVWDEYSHWAFDAKAVIANEKLTTGEEVVSSTRSYPPLLSIWHYLNSLAFDFSEQNLYIWLSIYILVCLMPAFSFIGRKNKYLLPFFALAMFFGVRLFGGVFGYTSLYADYACAVTYLLSFIIYFKYKNDDKNFDRMKKYLFLSLSMVVLIKPTGIIPAFVFFVIIILDDYLKLTNHKLTVKEFKKNIGILWKKYFKFGMSIVLVFAVWLAYVKICDMTVPKYYAEKVLSEGLETGLRYKANISFIGKVYKSFISAMDSSEICDFTLYQYSIGAVLLVFILVKIKNKTSIRQTIMKMFPYIVGAIVFYILTFVSIVVTFSAYEASMLASFTRYLNTFNVAMFLLLIIYACKEEFVKDDMCKVVSIIFILVVLSNIKVSEMTFFVSDYFSRASTREKSYSLQEKVQIINDNTPEDSKVYVIDQTDSDGIMAMWYARYYCFPRKINAYQTAINWKIRTDKNVDDLGDWGLTSEKLEEDLYKYKFDYLYLYTSADEMFEEMKDMFLDFDNAKNYKLFKIEYKDNNEVSLVGVN